MLRLQAAARRLVVSRRGIFAAAALLPLLAVVAFGLKESARPASGTVNLDFSQLDFHPAAELTPEGTAGGFERWLPAGIQAYNGREIRIRGYMLPTRTVNGLVREGVILRNQLACCFGQAPRFCEFIVMRVEGQPLSIPMDQPMTFTGRLQVRDVFDAGNWINLYTLENAKVD